MPLPGSVALALAGVALAADETALAATMLLGFAAFLRTCEMVGLTTQNVQVDEASGQIILALPSAKTSKQRMESVAICDPRLASLPTVVIGATAASSLACLTPDSFRTRLKLLLAHLRLDQHGFTAY